MASLRNLAISLLRMAGARYIAPALRACARLGLEVLRLIGVPSDFDGAVRPNALFFDANPSSQNRLTCFIRLSKIKMA